MTLKWRILGPLLASAGSMVGLPGAFFQEVFKGGILVPFVGGPMIEEAMKPCGVYILLAKWPQALSSRIYTAALSGLAGLVFGILENILYFEVYIPDASRELVIWRYTAGLALHTTTSFIVGFGINQKLVAAMKGEIPFLSANKRFFIAAMAIHSAYNVAAFVFLQNLFK